MSVSVTMPQLGESVTEGTVTRWLKQVGDTVTADEPLLEVSTDKVDTEIPAPSSGVLLSIAAAEDEVVAVGAPLAVIGDASEANGNGAAAPAQAAPAQAAAPAAPAAPAPTAPAAAPAPAAPPAPAPSAPAMSAPAPSAPAPSAPAVSTTAAPPASAPAASGGAGIAVVLPALGESVTEGTVTRWLKNVGDAVAADEPLLEVSTDKVDTEIPAPVGGVLLSIAVGEDAVAQVGAELGRIGEPGAAPAAPAPAAPAAPTPAPAAPTPPPAPPAPVAAPAAATPAPVPAAPAAAPAPQNAAPQNGTPQNAAPQPATATPGDAAPGPAAPGDAPYLTPIVRRLAAESGIDLTTVTGTGVGGRIRKSDIQAAVEAKAQAEAARAQAPAAAPSPSPAAAASPLRGRTEPLSRLRKVIADRMVESLHVSAQLTTVVEVDVTRIGLLRARRKADFAAREGVKLSYLPFFAKATVEALKHYPQLNASLDTAAGTVTYHESEHLGVAVDTERGLLVPVIRDAGDLNIAGLARKIADLAERTRNNKVSPDDLSGGTFTLTNTGSRGALLDTPIINQPQVAILGTGAVVKRAVVVTDDTGADVIAVRSMAYLALTYDHRLVDGADAARFLTAIKTRLEDGSFDAELGS
ncbi:MAG: 2-oxoglutarate dehydrogenase, E2 component, dihydrolipoamide succinyltransferase [Actinomycetota bacterium]|nr:MAG: 2-oxoglutarate dehydrogenase, E2 component, dihydrolipoamide succinyltransferase [Actinomycetota bacterium]